MKGQAGLYRFNGNVLVAKKGVIVYQASFGYSDFSTGQTLTANSVFDCGSIAKEFTAMGILLLKDKGLISYSDTLRKFFPRLPYSNITIRQLLTHTSGMPDGFELIETYFDHSSIASNDDLLRLLETKQPPLLFNPGEKLMYSGTGFNLLASVIEKVSGQSYNSYMDEQVFKPLGMTHTQVANGPRSSGNIPGYAYGYEYADGAHQYTRTDTGHSGWATYLAGITGEGMIVTSTADLLKWDRALKAHRLLTEATQQEMLSPQSHNPFLGISFGYGMRVGKNAFGNFIFHNGYYPGYLSMHLRYTDSDVTVIVLSNNESRADFIADGLAAIALGRDIRLPVAHSASAWLQVPEQYAGKYRMQLTRPPFMGLFPVEFIKKKDTLFIHVVNGADIKLRQESPQRFFFADGTDQQIVFETSADGSLLKAWHIAWGVKKELERIK